MIFAQLAIGWRPRPPVNTVVSVELAEQALTVTVKVKHTRACTWHTHTHFIYVYIKESYIRKQYYIDKLK